MLPKFKRKLDIILWIEDISNWDRYNYHVYMHNTICRYVLILLMKCWFSALLMVCASNDDLKSLYTRLGNSCQDAYWIATTYSCHFLVLVGYLIWTTLEQ